MKKVVILLPCYNEASTLKEKMEFLSSSLSQYKDYEFTYLISDDCSEDDTLKVAKSINYAQATTYEPHYGKGHAIKNGIQYALDNIDFDYLIFMDIDLSTELSAVVPTLKELEKTPFVIGSRYEKDSKILVKQPLSRRIVSKCSRIIIKCLFHFKTKDTQCGFKGMDKETAKLLVSKARVDGFSFDVEYLFILKLHNVPFSVVPVRWNDDRDSRVKVISSSIRFFLDLFKMKRNKKLYV